MKTIDIETKRRAICAKRGGWDNASDLDINNFWDSLGSKGQTEYLAAISTDTPAVNEDEKGDKDAVST